jgi:putative colanic acid biosynthesis acetyltransferase WcaF
MSATQAQREPDNTIGEVPRDQTSNAADRDESSGSESDFTLESVLAKPLPKGAFIGHFTRSEKIRRLAWNIVQATVFRFSPRRADNWRAMLLRLFGAKVGKVKLLRSTVRIEVPWNITIGDGAQIGDRVYLYSLGPITIGEHAVVSQFSHICAGTHDYERSDFPLLRVPVTIGARCWIAAETFVGPGVTIGDGVVVGARASVVHDLEPWMICVGAPAKPVAPRRLVDIHTGERLDQ